MAKQKIDAKIFRFNPDIDKKAYYQDYSVEVDRPVTIHELLTMIRKDMDATLAFRTYKCYKGMCQTCLVKLDGKTVKGCATMIDPDTSITLEPAGGGEVIRDLVVDFKAM
ncbi:MAG: Succinate dehydrogenase iron-sulfur subunit [Actinobacteria bacterium ADurb.Bin346]|nr:MAG: Succinate dehydrogenase iron-sulfur subunit [Actinobacteria bacterium ADurb.Bin346]